MGTVLADFTYLVGDGPVTVPVTSVSNQVAFSRTFHTGGIRTDQPVMLMFSVRNMGTGQADVFINDNDVGNVTSTLQGTFTTQTIIIGKGEDAEFKGDQQNEFAIKNVSNDFQIKDIVCFFHQES